MITDKDKIDDVLRVLKSLDRKVSAQYIYKNISKNKIANLHEVNQILDKLENDGSIKSELANTVFNKSGKIKVYQLAFDLKSSINKGETYETFQIKKKLPNIIYKIISALGVITTIYFSYKSYISNNELKEIKEENLKLTDSISNLIKSKKQ
jgi:hypothetical protein